MVEIDIGIYCLAKLGYSMLYEKRYKNDTEKMKDVEIMRLESQLGLNEIGETGFSESLKKLMQFESEAASKEQEPANTEEETSVENTNAAE